VTEEYNPIRIEAKDGDKCASAEDVDAITAWEALGNPIETWPGWKR